MSLALVLVAAACTGNQSDDTAGSSQETTTLPSDATDGSDATPGSLTTDEPPLSGLVADVAIVAPGDPVTLTGSPQLSGQLLLTGPDGAEVTAPFSDGTGTVELPTDAAEGRWQAVVVSDSGAIAVGVVDVASGPSLLLVADRSHVAPAGDVTVTLHAVGLPDDTQVMFGWGNLDWNAYFEDEEEEGEEPLGVLIPDQHGLLQLGATPAALSDVVGIPLAMGGGLEVAGLQAMAFSPTSEEFSMSDPLPLQGCAAPAPIRGTIGGPGAVHLLSFGNGLRSAAVVTADGMFGVEAPHGPTTLFAARDDGQALDPVSVAVPCAGTVDVDLVSGTVEIDDPGVVAAVEDDEFVAGESGTLTLSGDLSADFPVEPVCQYDGAVIDVIFGTFDLDLPAVQLTMSGGDVSGTHQGTVEITDWSNVTQSTGPVDVSIEYAGDVVFADAVMTLAGDYGGEAGAGSIEGTFSCIVLGLTPPATEDGSTEPEVEEEPDELLVDLPPTVFDTPGFDSAIAAPACRIIVVDDLDDPATGIMTAASLRTGLSRATVLTLSELHALFGPDRNGELLGPGRSSSVGFDVEEGTPVTLVENEGYADELAGQVTCVDVEPVDVTSGETVQITVQATNLAGDPISEAEVVTGESECGSDEPPEGTLLDGEFEWTFTGGDVTGEESVPVQICGGGGHPPEVVIVDVATGFSYILEGQYRVELNPHDPNVPIPAGPLAITLVASSCVSRSGPWEGVLILEAGPLLAMMELTGLAGDVAGVLFGDTITTYSTSAPGWGTWQRLVVVPLPDIGISALVADGVNPGGGALKLFVQEVLWLGGIDNPYRPIVLPVSFSLPPEGGESVVKINGRSSKFSLEGGPAPSDVVQLKTGNSHLLKAAVSRDSTCPTDAELAERVGELVPDPSPWTEGD